MSFAGYAWRHPAVGLAGLLAPPLAWFVLIYLAALLVLFVRPAAFAARRPPSWQAK